MPPLIKHKIISLIFVIPFVTSYGQIKNDLLPSENTLRIMYDNRDLFINPNLSFGNYTFKCETQFPFYRYILDDLVHWEKDLSNDILDSYEFPYNIQFEAFNMKEFIRHDTLLTDDYTYKVLIDTLIDPSHLTFFKFIEDWYYDARRFTFVKKIMAISPVEKVFIELPDGNYDEKGLFSKFWIKNTQAKPEKLELLYTMEYEFPIYNTEFIKMQERIENGDLMDISYYEKENAPYWNSYARTIFINSLITKIRNKEIKAYNYQSKEPMLDDADLFYALGGRVDTIQYMDPITEELILLTVSNQPEVKNISSIIFKEELYWDKDKHYFEKKVISIAPVVKRYIFDSNTSDITVKQTPCCVVYFNNN